MGVDPVGPERFRDVRAVRVVENGLYVAVHLLWGAHFLALYHALRRANRAPAVFGTALVVFGLSMLVAGALPHVATDPIADLYHAAGATPGDKATLDLMWHATQGLFDTLLVTGLVILPVGLVFLGVAMRGAPDFGRRLGAMSIVFGILGVVAGIVLLVDPASPLPVAVFATFIVFHIVLGRTAYRLGGTAAVRQSVTTERLPL